MKTILCVDDEAIILMSLKTEIQKRYKGRVLVETALSADSALLLVEEMKAEGAELILVISDLQMPGMKGDVLLKLLKNKYPKIHLIMITGQADQETLKNLSETVPMLAILDKPWDKTLLAKHIDSVTEIK